MQLDNNQLHALLTFLEGSDIQELKLEGEDFRLEVRRNLPAPPVAAPAAYAPVAMAAPVPAAPAPAAPQPPSAPPAAAAVRADLVDVTAPMVGTFYRAASPGDPPFVELGSAISVGQPVCIRGDEADERTGGGNEWPGGGNPGGEWHPGGIRPGADARQARLNQRGAHQPCSALTQLPISPVPRRR